MREHADEVATPLRRWEQAERTLRVVEAPSDRLGSVYGELERVVQLLAEERTKLERLFFSRGPAG